MLLYDVDITEGVHMSRDKSLAVKAKCLTKTSLKKISPMTDNQTKTFEAFGDDKHLMLHGCAGTGKTFIMIYLAMKAVLSGRVDQQKVYIVRSMLPTRDIGFLPGTADEKMSVYAEPYYSLFDELFPEIENPYELAKYQDVVEFVPTSYIRGITLRDAFVIVDECQNLNFHELDTIITRVGENSRIFFCGDFMQSDLKNHNEQQGIIQFMDIIKNIQSFEIIDFKEEDIVRSGLVKEYIISKNRKEYKGLFESIDKKMKVA
jgi:phosphate starvation-inducible protein PhoH